MRVVLAGGTGFLGSTLARALRGAGDEVTVLTRQAREPGQVAWDPRASGPWQQLVGGADAVINLAGEPLDQGRWTEARKQRILDSRIVTARAIAAAAREATIPPKVLLSASAVGVYGPRADETVTESTPPADDFLASVCTAWEREAMTASPRSRVVLLRTGLVLGRSGGALPRLALPFRFFVGGPVGTGKQWWSWIHLADWVALVRWAIDTPQVSGPLNLTAPSPVTSQEFARALGRVLRRPSAMPAPAFALRLLLGEMAEALVLTGQRVSPQRALEGGFAFAFPTLEPALRDLYRRA